MLGYSFTLVFAEPHTPDARVWFRPGLLSTRSSPPRILLGKKPRVPDRGGVADFSGQPHTPGQERVHE